MIVDPALRMQPAAAFGPKARHKPPLTIIDLSEQTSVGGGKKQGRFSFGSQCAEPVKLGGLPRGESRGLEMESVFN